MNNLKLMDSDSLELVDERYSLPNINKAFYVVLQHELGDDFSIRACSGLSVHQLDDVKRGLADLATIEQACNSLFYQLVYAHCDLGIQARVKTGRVIYRISP